jgi:hypothetical protein
MQTFVMLTRLARGRMEATILADRLGRMNQHGDRCDRSDAL